MVFGWLLNLLAPHVFIRHQFLHAKLHLGQNFAQVAEQGNGKQIHETDLRLGKRDNGAGHWGCDQG
jgi:hypothetical protein